MIGIDEDDLLERHREKNVKEEDLVSPDGALLLFLCAQPRRPFVGDQFILEVVLGGEVRDKFLEGRISHRLIEKTNRRTRNEGDKKFSMNQNFTVPFVLRSTLRIMIDAKRYDAISGRQKTAERNSPHTTTRRRR